MAVRPSVRATIGYLVYKLHRDVSSDHIFVGIKTGRNLYGDGTIVLPAGWFKIFGRFITSKIGPLINNLRMVNVNALHS